MAPKRRVVKTVRKSTPKSKTPASKSRAAAAAAETPIPEASPPSPAATEAPASQSTRSTTPPPVDSGTASPAAAETPVAEPATTPEPATTETPTSEPAAAPEASEPAAAEAPVSEPATASEPPAASEHVSPAASEPVDLETSAAEPLETASKPTRKTTRVVKVVKKKIIKKRVPKASSLAKEEEKAPEEAGDLPAVPAEETPVLQPEPENPSSDAAASEAHAQQEDAMETENIDSREESKDVTVEQDKGKGAEEAKATAAAAAAGDEEAGISERRRRRKTEIFIGGLDRDAKEEDIRKVFGKAGEIVEVRMMMDGQTGKNKGYCFLRYKEAAQAKKAVAEFSKVEVCGKLCGAAALEGNDTIFLGNIDKKWKKEDVIKLLQGIGIEKIDTVTVVADPNNADSNRGFAFLELETNRDAQIAYKKLQKKDAFGKGRNIKVAWAEPLNDPDEEEMQKVKSVYVEGVPLSWNEDKVRESFIKFGEIERIVLARNIPSAKRKDFAFVNYTIREAALSCIESFDKEGITENGLKVNLKVSLAKPVQKGKQNKGGSKSSNKDKEKPKAVYRETKVTVSSNKEKSFKGSHTASGVDKKSSTTHELLNVLREQATWKQGQTGYARGSAVQDYPHVLPGGKRAFSAMGDDTVYSDLRGYPRARLESSFPIASSSYGAPPHGTAGSSLPYHQRPAAAGYASGSLYGAAEYPSTVQMRQGAPPYGSSLYSRY